jgi:hypothetical protein
MFANALIICSRLLFSLFIHASLVNSLFTSFTRVTPYLFATLIYTARTIVLAHSCCALVIGCLSYMYSSLCSSYMYSSYLHRSLCSLLYLTIPPCSLYLLALSAYIHSLHSCCTYLQDTNVRAQSRVSHMWDLKVLV